MINKKNRVPIALALVLVIAATLVTSAQVSAQLQYDKGFVSLRPNPVGINQVLLVNAWVSPQPPLTDPNSMAGRPRHNYMFVFTKPDGTKMTVGPLDSYGEGTTWFTITPDALGTWSVKFTWPGDELFQPCEVTSQFTVQQTQVPTWPAAALPTGYWEFPINLDNREWFSIAGNWLMTSYNNSNSWQGSGGFNPYTTAPNSAHIVWTRNSGIGGIIGGEYGTLYGSTGSFSPPLIVDGYLYYNNPTGFTRVKLSTGESMYNATGSINIAVPAPGGNGELRSIGGTTYVRYNAYTGALIQTLTNATPGYLSWAGWDGQRMWAIVKENYIYCWNSSKVVGTNWASGVVWNSTTGLRTGGHLRTNGEVVVCAGVSEGSIAAGPSNLTSISIGFNATTGQQLYRIVRPYILATESVVGYGKLYQASISTGQLKAFDLYTGAELWSKDMPYPWGTFASYTPTCAYGNLYWGTYDGNLWCINPANGNTVWNFSSGQSGDETPYGSWPFWLGPTVADGKVYAGTSEHSPSQPHIRGCRLYCVDALTGKMIWSLAGSIGSLAAANGFLVGCNENDATIYAFAKGQTQTTVMAAPDVATSGSSVLIKGTVMDLSPAQPNTPAIADQDMTAWMEYLHMQVPLPTGTSTYPYYATGTPTTFSGTGVTVKLTATDQTGQTFNIGSATSDASGLYSIMWKPPAEGKYTVIASFDGTNSYYSSYAETAFGVTAASPVTTLVPVPTPTASPSASASASPVATTPGTTTPTNNNIYFIALAAVIVVAIIVAAAILLRRRK